MGQYFQIEKIDTESFLVIILSCELTSVYWIKLLDVFQKNRIANKTVYFDFLIRNGFDNRFFMSYLNGNSKFESQLRSCDVCDGFESISRSFFSMHMDLLSTSILSERQIHDFIHGEVR